MENKKESSPRRTANQGTPPPTSSTSTTGLNVPVPGPTRPVLNHPILTGEECAQKFMRDRAMSTMFSASFPPAQFPILPYRRHRGISSVFRTGSENPNQNPPARSVPAPGPSRAISGTSFEVASASVRSWVNCIVSFNGTILPSPGDGELVYVGGESYIFPIKYSISFQELMELTRAVYDVPHTIKYQHHGMDLDALVSVWDDGDVRCMMEMMEECDGILYSSSEVGGDFEMLRLFLVCNPCTDDDDYGVLRPIEIDY